MNSFGVKGFNPAKHKWFWFTVRTQKGPCSLDLANFDLINLKASWPTTKFKIAQYPKE